jgi:hypothetical protein
MPQMGVGVPDKVMVALCKRRISLLLDHQADQLVQPGQTATAIMMSTVLSVSVELKLASVAVLNGTCELDSRGSPRARLLCEFGLWTTCWHM